MNQTVGLFERAQKLHEKGLLKQAEPLYKQWLEANPNDEEALFWLASLYTNQERHKEAVPLYYRALEQNPAAVETHTGLGLALNALGQAAEAEASFRLALDLSPELPELHYYLGSALFTQEKYAEAETAFRQAMKRKPNFQEAQINLRETLLRRDKAEEAAKVERLRVEERESAAAAAAAPKASVAPARVKLLPARPLTAANYVNEANLLAKDFKRAEAYPLYQKALEVNPNFQPAYYGWGTALLSAGQAVEALPLLEKAVALLPNHEGAVTNLANALLSTGQYERSCALFRQATELAPNNPLHWMSLSAVLVFVRNLPEAEDAARRALALNPNLATAEINLGISLMEQGRHEEAMRHCQKAEQALPDHVENLVMLATLYGRRDDFEMAKTTLQRILAHRPKDVRTLSDLGILKLLFGHFEEGWEDYKATYMLSDASRRRFDKPEWKGEIAPDATVFVQINQGVGDCIQFLRYLMPLKAKVGRIVLEASPSTRPLYENYSAVDEIVPVNAPAEYDYHICSTLLAGLFWKECGALPTASYLTADAEKSAQWRARFAAEPGFKVGIVWAGNAEYVNDHLRSTTLAAFAPLKDVPNVRLYSLQKGERARQAENPPDGMTLIDLDGDLNDYGDTAAAIANLDLVISVDTSVAHLAGALGKPVWTLLPFVPEWRWLRRGDTTHWYPNMRLFRPATFNGWQEQLERVAAELNRLVNSEANGGAKTEADDETEPKN